MQGTRTVQDGWISALRALWELNTPRIAKEQAQHSLHQGFSDGAIGALLVATEQFSGDHEQRPSLGSFAVSLHDPSVTIY